MPVWFGVAISARSQTEVLSKLQHMLHIAVAYLHHRAELLVEQRAQRVAVQFIELDVQADMRAKAISAQRHKMRRHAERSW